MSQATSKPISLQFETMEQARAFRKNCYRQREALRLIGISDYDGLKFKLIRNTLTIKARESKIEDLL